MTCSLFNKINKSIYIIYSFYDTERNWIKYQLLLFSKSIFQLIIQWTLDIHH